MFFWNLSNQWKHWQSVKRIEKTAPSGSAGSHLSSRSSFLPSFVHPAWVIKFADTCVWLENLCVKSTTKRNLQHKVLSVRVLLTCAGGGDSYPRLGCEIEADLRFQYFMWVHSTSEKILTYGGVTCGACSAPGQGWRRGNRQCVHWRAIMFKVLFNQNPSILAHWGKNQLCNFVQV